jgi:hypothetical protein
MLPVRLFLLSVLASLLVAQDYPIGIQPAPINLGNLIVTGGTLDNVVIGGTTPAAGTFTTLGSTGVATLGGASAPSANTFTGNLIWGRNTAATDTTGAVGETVSSIVTSPVNCAGSGSPGNITSVSLTAGKWQMSLNLVLAGGSTGFTPGGPVLFSITTSSGNNGTPGNNCMELNVPFATATPGGQIVATIPCYIVNLSATTTEYATAQVPYVSGQAIAYGRLDAIRLP